MEFDKNHDLNFITFSRENRKLFLNNFLMTLILDFTLNKIVEQYKKFTVFLIQSMTKHIFTAEIVSQSMKTFTTTKNRCSSKSPS